MSRLGKIGASCLDAIITAAAILPFITRQDIVGVTKRAFGRVRAIVFDDARILPVNRHRSVELEPVSGHKNDGTTGNTDLARPSGAAIVGNTVAAVEQERNLPGRTYRIAAVSDARIRSPGNRFGGSQGNCGAIGGYRSARQIDLSCHTPCTGDRGIDDIPVRNTNQELTGIAVYDEVLRFRNTNETDARFVLPTEALLSERSARAVEDQCEAEDKTRQY
ncbi:hypothetical protein T8J41_14505 [Nitratireductor rhodophyticola]|uniref:hypothetical protein n=1 Tax=Nitratireductor rhodophyticola TaxID=2854036 RepID=UPI002AC98B3C|nr:hypothetical protein [Nitratireductor rhodophyticola]WPZ13359.1 hypothetical protein T8J41_14505 [Nitratireductor rhodophyticola]